MIRLRCPNCRRKLTAHESMASTKVMCPQCAQKILVPAAPPVPPPLPVATDKTKLGLPDEDNPPVAHASLGYSIVPVAETFTATPAPGPQGTLYQACQACGATLDMTHIPTGEAFVCPKCGRENRPKRVARASGPETHDQPRRHRRDDADELDDEEEGRFRCPFCRHRGLPVFRQKIAPAGWAVMGVIAGTCVLLGLILCLPLFLTPLCLLGLLIKDNYRVCRGCGMTLP